MLTVYNCLRFDEGGLAQLVEQGTHKPCVVGPIPTPATFGLGFNVLPADFHSAKSFRVCGWPPVGPSMQ